ncbi:MAG: 3-deoxy-D-manno-octulosonic acid transferase [Flavobacteriales bacterium]|nr:3-deoxy-D-manno-octulosonic acid transferase [Flavobacteriales bacterium]
MRFLYNLGIQLYGLGIVLASIFNQKARLWVKGRKNFFNQLENQTFKGNWIWFHCASLGEFEQGRPVIEEIKIQRPELSVLLTFFSPSGYEIRKNYKHADCILYLPLDTKNNAKQFIKKINPKLAVFIKYEFWHNYINALHTNKIPIISISAIFRQNQRFFKKNSSFQHVLRQFDHFFVQNQSSAQLLSTIGIKNITIAGDTRFDRVKTITESDFIHSKIESFVNDEKIIVLGSSWPKDEKILIDYLKLDLGWKLIVAPHEVHESNIERISDELKQSNLVFNKLSDSTIDAQAQVLIIDSIGLLSKIYKYGTVTHVGGGFNSGIHNILEPLTWGKPVSFGPKWQNFQEAHDAIEKGFGAAVENTQELKDLHTRWLQSTTAKVGQNAKTYIDQNAGATETIIKYINVKL